MITKGLLVHALVGDDAQCHTAPGAGCTWTFNPTTDTEHRVALVDGHHLLRNGLGATVNALGG